MLKRRGLLAGLLFAPAIIRTPGLLMPVKPWLPVEAEDDETLIFLNGVVHMGRTTYW